MNTNVNLLAPIGVMALLGADFLLFRAAFVLPCDDFGSAAWVCNLAPQPAAST